jgi:hypothetical protein
LARFVHRVAPALMTTAAIDRPAVSDDRSAGMARAIGRAGSIGSAASLSTSVELAREFSAIFAMIVLPGAGG